MYCNILNEDMQKIETQKCYIHTQTVTNPYKVLFPLLIGQGYLKKLNKLH